MTTALVLGIAAVWALRSIDLVSWLDPARIESWLFIPSGSQHGIRNSGTSTLRYFSAAAPGFGQDELRTLWPLPSEQEETAR